MWDKNSGHKYYKTHDRNKRKFQSEDKKIKNIMGRNQHHFSVLGNNEDK